MDSDERTYSKSEIRERRRELSQLVALQQRHLDALAKMDEAADELEQVEREIAALTSGETQAGQPDPVVPSDPATTGTRSLAILKTHPGTWLHVRNVLGESAERGWTSGDEHARQSYRAALRRLARHNDQVERDESGITHFYRWVPGRDDEQQALNVDPVMHVNGSGYPVHQGGQGDD